MLHTLPIFTWKTPASKIPAQKIGRYKIFKRPIRKNTTLDMGGVFGYDECIFIRDNILTVFYEGELNPKLDPKGVWMSDSPAEYYAMWELVARTTPPNVLIGGLGLGILANLLAMRTDVKKVVVVELSPEVIKMIKPYLNKKIRVIRGDFIEVMADLSYRGVKFNTVISDIFKGFDEDELFEDCVNAMNDYYPAATHLFWLYQKRYEREEILYYFWRRY